MSLSLNYYLKKKKNTSNLIWVLNVSLHSLKVIQILLFLLLRKLKKTMLSEQKKGQEGKKENWNLTALHGQALQGTEKRKLFGLISK